MLLPEGTLFASRYQIIRCIATGGMGTVYEVLHLDTQRKRALKVMHPNVVQSDEMRERFKREATITAQVESEFIVDVFDAGVDPSTKMPFLVMELLRGEELGKRLKRLGRLSPQEVVTYLHQTALALEKTHKANIVHRDLKPANLFLTEREDGLPRVKVLDFGVAKIVAEAATTGATQSLGTPLYMAPEQFNAQALLTPAADIFALGMMAYTLLVGAPYWADETKSGNVFAVMAVAMLGPQQPPSQRAAPRGVALSPAFDAWFARTTAFDGRYRFGSALETVQALAQALGVDLATKTAFPSLRPSADASLSGPSTYPSGPAAGVITGHPSGTTGGAMGQPSGLLPGSTTGHPSGLAAASTTGHPSGLTPLITTGQPVTKPKSLKWLVIGLSVAVVGLGSTAVYVGYGQLSQPQEAAEPVPSESVTAAATESAAAVATETPQAEVMPSAQATTEAEVLPSEAPTGSAEAVPTETAVGQAAPVVATATNVPKAVPIPKATATASSTTQKKYTRD